MFDKLNKVKIKYNEPLCKHTTYKLGGVAKIFINAKNSDLEYIFEECNKTNIDYYVLGSGSNVLVSDNGFNGVVIKIDEQYINFNNNKVFVTNGYNLSNLIKETTNHGLSGLEWAIGIPGTVGGAIVMNAGAFDNNISDSLSRCSVLDNYKKKEYNKSDCEFSYRSSIFSKNSNLIVLDAEFELKEAQSMEIFIKTEKYKQLRLNKQPRGNSCGSVFKNTIDYNAAEVIESCDLKGKSIGSATVSTKHANFIISSKKGLAKDVYDLINYIKEKVYTQTGILLTEEVKFVGEF